jgi:hypothetical protein
VIGFLRFLGIANAAVWFGAAVFFTFAVGPGIFSEDMRSVLGVAPGAFRFFAGGIALVIIKRYFILQYVCGTLAFLHLAAERLYLGRRTNRWVVGAIIVMFSAVLVGGLWLRPRMITLRQAIYSAPTQQEKDQAHHSFAVLHGVSMTVNLFLIAGQVVLLARVSRPPDASRYGTFYQIP